MQFIYMEFPELLEAEHVTIVKDFPLISASLLPHFETAMCTIDHRPHSPYYTSHGGPGLHYASF